MVWLSIALVVLGIAFVVRGALLSSAQPIRLPFRSLPLPSARTALIVGGVAVVGVLGTAAMNLDTPSSREQTDRLVQSDQDHDRRTILSMTAPAAPAREGQAAAQPFAENAPDAAPAASPPSSPLSRTQIFTNTTDDDGENTRRSRSREAEPTATPPPEEDDDEDDDKDGGKKKGDEGSGRGHDDD